MNAPTLRTDVEIVTLGCRLNAYESEAMRALAREAALTDAVIVNTCAVTVEAVRQARQAIRRARRERPAAQIIVTGCAAQIDPEAFSAMPEVNRVIGNGEKMRAASFASNEERVLVSDIMNVREISPHLTDGFSERTRAYVQVQNGCDHRCTFCIIPHGRGNSRSAAAGDVIEQVRRLADNGVPEVVLTGVDLTSWGEDLPGSPKLGALVARILKHVHELQMLRLSSLDAIEMDAQLFELVTQHERVAPHLHLSLQHGDDLILKRMKRRHSRSDAIELCVRLKALRPAIALGADLIAGFPTEEETHFASTLSLIEECGLSFVHAFPYSARQGTPAARMPQVERSVVKERAARLRGAGAKAIAAHLDAWVGREAEALREREGFARLADFTGVKYVPTAPSPAGAATAGEGAVGTYSRLRFTTHDGANLIGAPA